MKVKAAILVDNLSITRWQKLALDEAKDKIDILLILNCTNTKTKKNIFRNCLYYILNYFSLKNAFTKQENLDDIETDRISFFSNYIGVWQTIPDTVVKRLRANRITLVIKFGMGLLKIEENFFSLTCDKENS